MGALKSEDVLRDLPTLETDRLLLCKIVLDDIEDIFAYASDPEVPKYMPWEPHRSLEDTDEDDMD
jgi:ribosomal-protein-alanine N-acetyltransferase